MGNRRSNLEDHISTLEHFEKLYREYLEARRRIEAVAWGNGERRWLDSDSTWTERRRELQELAPQAEAAMVAAGARRWDEGPVRIDLPLRIFHFTENNFGDPGDEEQQKILEELPTHIGALKGKVRSADEPKRRRTPRHGLSALWHEPNPWVLVVVGTIVATIIAALLIAKFS